MQRLAGYGIAAVTLCLLLFQGVHGAKIETYQFDDPARSREASVPLRSTRGRRFFATLPTIPVPIGTDSAWRDAALTPHTARSPRFVLSGSTR